MDFRYRIIGTVKMPFILRGLFYKIGVNINALLTEKELDFVKDRCQVSQIIDLNEQEQMDNSIPKVLEKTSEVKNELPKQPKRTVKSANKKNI